MSGMAEVLAKRNFEHEWGGEWEECPEDAKPGWIKDAQETLDFLSAAGFRHLATAAGSSSKAQVSCPTQLTDGRNEIRCWLNEGHEGDCK